MCLIILKYSRVLIVLVFMVGVSVNCSSPSPEVPTEVTAAEILGNETYPCIAYGSFRASSRSVVPSVAEIKEDMRILYALGFRMIHTYHTQKFDDTKNVLRAIKELKKQDKGFEMYVMLGAWIECAAAFTAAPNHLDENLENNSAEIETALKMATQYSDIVKIIAVGNEAMVHWAEPYYVDAKVILKWVRYVKAKRARYEIPADIWVTSSDNFASWGGGEGSYHNNNLEALIKEVDYVSMHTYPFHDTHYNPAFWYSRSDTSTPGDWNNIHSAMNRAVEYARSQYYATQKYVSAIDPTKPVHIGETGWASLSSGFYGRQGSRAADEYKQKLFFDGILRWTRDSSISCFFFEAFDEPWKDPDDVNGSENHFGLIDIQNKAKYVIWDRVSSGTLDGLTRNSRKIEKTYAGMRDSLMTDILPPPFKD